MNDIQNRLAAGEFFNVIEEIQRAGSPAEVAERYASLLLDLYWKQHDLPAVVAIGRAGILYCLTQSVTEGVAVESSARLRSAAKGLAYNVGSFTWPGWEEPGISPTAADLAAGRECASLNLRLAIELKKPADRIAMAHWLVGAHAMASRDADLAEVQFRSGAALLGEDASTEVLKQYMSGCLVAARLGREPNSGEKRASFDAIALDLVASADEDAQVYLSQLRAMLRLFVNRDS